MDVGPLELLIFQGTPFCNIDCTYCYLPDRLNTSKMDIGIVRHTITKLVEENIVRDDFAVLWHAGEPLVLPVAYYEEAIRVIRNAVPEHIPVTFSFQTNATLLNKQWCQFFARHNAELGVSIDGPKFIHDRNRLTRTGKGTFDTIMPAINLLKRMGMPVNIISVVTDFSCSYPEEMYAFYRDIGAQAVSFNVEEVEGANKTSSFSGSVSAKERVKKFLEAVFRLNLVDGEPLQLREFNWAKSSVLFGDMENNELNLSQMTGPYKTITVVTNGDFSTFSPELISQKSNRYGDFVLGNVVTDSFRDALTTEKFNLIYSDLLSGIEKCRKNCVYYGLCPGGIPSSKFSEQQTLDTDETQYCRLALQAPIDVILDMAEDSRGEMT